MALLVACCINFVFFPMLSYVHMQRQTIPEEDTVAISSQKYHSSYQLAEFRYVFSIVLIFRY